MAACRSSGEPPRHRYIDMDRLVRYVRRLCEADHRIDVYRAHESRE